MIAPPNVCFYYTPIVAVGVNSKTSVFCLIKKYYSIAAVTVDLESTSGFKLRVTKI
jgi:hypothetical protein